MKGYFVNCITCGTKFKKKTNHHKHCKTACRNKSSRVKNNIPEPDFMKKINSPSQPIKATVGALSNNIAPIQEIPSIKQESPIEYRSSGLVVNLENQKLYWENVIRDANSGVLPIWTIGLGAVGGIKYENALAAIVGGLIGHQIDKQREISKRDKAIEVIAHAKYKIDEISLQLKSLKKMESSLKPLLKNGRLERNTKGNIIEASEYKREYIPTIGYKDKWKYLFGDPAPGYYLLFTGLPGNGKTTAAIKLANYHSKNFGKTIYLSSEQRGINKPFQNLLRDNDADFTIDTNPTSDINKLAKQLQPYSMVVFDSVNHLNIDTDGIEFIRKKNPNLCIVCVMQSTKDGNHKGSQEFLHNCDIRVNMENGQAMQTKSRYSPKSDINIFS